MHVISRKKLREFAEEHQDAEEPLDAWYRVAKRATWENFAELREIYPHADLVNDFTVFNIGGNKYRLISDIYFDDQIILIHYVLTHQDYDKGSWKIRPPRV